MADRAPTEHEHVGGDPMQCEVCGHSEGHPLHTEPQRIGIDVRP